MILGNEVGHAEGQVESMNSSASEKAIPDALPLLASSCTHHLHIIYRDRSWQYVRTVRSAMSSTGRMLQAG